LFPSSSFTPRSEGCQPPILLLPSLFALVRRLKRLLPPFSPTPRQGITPLNIKKFGPEGPRRADTAWAPISFEFPPSIFQLALALRRPVFSLELLLCFQSVGNSKKLPFFFPFSSDLARPAHFAGASLQEPSLRLFTSLAEGTLDNPSFSHVPPSFLFAVMQVAGFSTS